MSEIKLKPCPFCGGKAREEVIPSNAILDRYEVRIYCQYCNCTTSWYTKYPFQDMEFVKNEVRIIWNSRAKEIVHCKDCKFFGNGDCSVQSVRNMYPDDFCSYGERKEK